VTVSLVCLHQPCLCRFRAIRSHLGDFPCSWGQAVLRAEGGLLPISPAKASAPFPFGEERSSVVFLLAAGSAGGRQGCVRLVQPASEGVVDDVCER